MSRRFGRLTGAVALTFAVAFGGVGAAAGPAAASPLPIEECTTTSGVVLAVDFSKWGGPLLRSCGTTPTTGYVLLNQGGWKTTGTGHDGPAFICRIGYSGFQGGKQFPTPDQEKCVLTPPATAYWSYWHADPGQNDWSYSQLGAMSYQPKPGSVDLWIFGGTNIEGTEGRPVVSPDTLRAHNTAPGGGTTPVTPEPPQPPAGSGGGGSTGGTGGGSTGTTGGSGSTGSTGSTGGANGGANGGSSGTSSAGSSGSSSGSSGGNASGSSGGTGGTSSGSGSGSSGSSGGGTAGGTGSGTAGSGGAPVTKRPPATGGTSGTSGTAGGRSAGTAGAPATTPANPQGEAPAPTAPEPEVPAATADPTGDPSAEPAPADTPPATGTATETAAPTPDASTSQPAHAAGPVVVDAAPAADAPHDSGSMVPAVVGAVLVVVLGVATVLTARRRRRQAE
ncbi:hypothetical protein ACFC26_02645 [Kitasatospora purpeofusca]|uniref:hypothetical protein n=1 Tax=Kitasatospora purpeofusca TaxID=67352 RepID=UPI0035DD2844